MNLAQILNLLRNEPLLCDNNYRATLLELFDQHAALDRAEFKHKRTGMRASGSELEVDEAEVHDGVAIIPVGGPLGIRLTSPSADAPWEMASAASATVLIQQTFTRGATWCATAPPVTQWEPQGPEHLRCDGSAPACR